MAIDLAEVGAGGGSQMWIDPADSLQAGLAGSGAMPGAVCCDIVGTVPTHTDAKARTVFKEAIRDRPRVPDRIRIKTVPTRIVAKRRLYFGLERGWFDAPLRARADLEKKRTGPLVVEEYDATCGVPPTTAATVEASGNVLVGLQSSAATTRPKQRARAVGCRWRRALGNVRSRSPSLRQTWALGPCRWLGRSRLRP